MFNCSLQFFQHSEYLMKMWSNKIKQNDIGQSLWIWELFLHMLPSEDVKWKSQDKILVKWQFFFKTLTFENGFNYKALLGLDWKIICFSLLICFCFFIGYWGLAAIDMGRCLYIYELDIIMIFAIFMDITPIALPDWAELFLCSSIIMWQLYSFFSKIIDSLMVNFCANFSVKFKFSL